MFFKILKISKSKIIKLSDLNINQSFRKDNLIYEICSHLKTDKYISTIGAEIYLKENKKLNKDFKIQYFEYHQNKDELLYYNKKKCHLSIIDLLFNHGDQAKNIIKSNFRIINK